MIRNGLIGCFDGVKERIIDTNRLWGGSSKDSSVVGWRVLTLVSFFLFQIGFEFSDADHIDDSKFLLGIPRDP